LIFGAEHRRFIVAINRLLYLKYVGFDFSNKRTSFITLSLSNLYVGDVKRIHLAKEKVFRLLQRWGCDKYVIAKELGALRGRLHFHIIAFNCPFIPASYDIYLKYSKRRGLDLSERKLRNNLKDVWRLGRSGIEQGYGAENSALFYLIKYAKKGLRLQWSTGFNAVMPLVGFIYNVQYNYESREVEKRFPEYEMLIEKQGEAYQRFRDFCFSMPYNDFIRQVQDYQIDREPHLPLVYRLAHLPFH
jgi:hypothetical protein